ncbi:MAG: molybdenum cofactor synthesis domain-containing protein, partial [Anaerolineales bacterium]|nr:molybdenum cofactor synthesis domain-containing protein [Anaerolineales bacterium]
MEEFLFLEPPGKALEKFLSHLNIRPSEERIPSWDSLGRVVFGPVAAPFSLPAFRRSTVDGYAVLASDTHGASQSLPAYLRIQGEVRMGEDSELSLESQACAAIHTGGMLPGGADAVVMIENTELLDGSQVEIMRPAAPGENVIQVGEDVLEGESILRAGVRIGPAEIGGLMALGLDEINVSKQPRIGIISAGDEVVPPGAPLLPGQVYDINTYSLAALIEQNGGLPSAYGIAEDTFAALREIAARALYECDMVVLTAGSSLGMRDLTAQVINSLGEPGVIIHGVNVRPGKPTILGVCGQKPVIGLPGNPASALVIARIFILPLIKAYL